jgi:hypothetical protein
LGGRGRLISEFEASLVYKMSSRTARATQRNSVSKNQKKTKKKKNKKKNKKKKVMLIVGNDKKNDRERQECQWAVGQTCTCHSDCGERPGAWEARKGR